MGIVSPVRGGSKAIVSPSIVATVAAIVAILSSMLHTDTSIVLIVSTVYKKWRARPWLPVLNGATRTNKQSNKPLVKYVTTGESINKGGWVSREKCIISLTLGQ